MRISTATYALVLALGLALTAAGCGSKSASGPTPAKAAGPVKKAASPTDALSPYLVAAVVTTKGGATLLQVKYELGGRPEVGDPVDVDLVVVPQADNIDHFSGSIQADDGLDVVAGGTFSPTEKLSFGVPIHHAVKVVAKRDGIFTLNAAFSLESAGEAFAPIYSMPIIAGNGLADAGAAPVPTPGSPKQPAAAAAH